MDNIYNLSEVISDCDFLKLQSDVSAATKVAIITVDYTGAPVTEHSRCSAFCRAVRDDPQLGKLCEKCDSRGGLEAARLGKPYAYTCHMGLVDFAVPIIYKGYYLGAIMCGQLRLAGGEELERIIVEKGDLSQIEDGERLYGELPQIRREDMDAIINMISYICNYRISGALGGTAQPGERRNRDRITLEPALKYIENNYKAKQRISDLAGMCRISEGHFSRLFRKVTGESFVDYVNGVRVEKAKVLLASGEMSVGATAYECGFDDPGYFIKVFTAREGITPGKWRCGGNVKQ